MVKSSYIIAVILVLSTLGEHNVQSREHCGINNGGCEYMCRNRVDTCECKCKWSYALDSDKKSCHYKNCGKQHIVKRPQISSRIIGGTPADEGKWPWQVGLWVTGETGPFCGGTLIKPNIVVTAAHCVKKPNKPSEYRVRVGDHSLKTSGKQEQVVQVKRIIKHRDFDMIKYVNDIAIILLTKEVKLEKMVNVACLPKKEEIFNNKCFVTGWGNLKNSRDGRYPDILQEVEVPIVSSDICREANAGNLYRGMICAGYAKGGKDSCDGDSGGPLVCRQKDGRFELRGIVSYGYGCALANKYGVYTDVYHYVDWIKRNIVGILHG